MSLTALVCKDCGAMFLKTLVKSYAVQGKHFGNTPCAVCEVEEPAYREIPLEYDVVQELSDAESHGFNSKDFL